MHRKKAYDDKALANTEILCNAICLATEGPGVVGGIDPAPLHSVEETQIEAQAHNWRAEKEQ
jgi:hypothetical protein